MRYWTTHIKAIDPADGQLKTWFGPNVPGITYEDAELYCEQNGLGYCKVIGELVKEIPIQKDSITPDWSSAVDFIKIAMN